MRLAFLIGSLLAASVAVAGCGGGRSSESPAFSAVARANGMIAIGNPTDNQIDVVWPDGRTLHMLVRYGSSPAWSPDGRRLAYVGSAVTYNPRLYVTGADGRGTRRLPVNFDLDYEIGAAISWSPDGRKLAFDGGPSGEDHIYVVNANGRGLRRLTTGHEDTTPTWSPDGKKIAFVRGVSEFDIYVMNADGSGQHKLTDGDSPAWSPDGKTIAFARGGGAYSLQAGSLYGMSPDGGNEHKLGTGTSPTWSPDGKLLAYFCCSGYSNSGNGVFTIGADGGRPRRLVRYTAGPISLSWQPLPRAGAGS